MPGFNPLGPSNPLSKLDMSHFRPPIIEIPTNPNLASEFHQRLVDWINKFDAELDGEHEVGVRLVSFGQSVVFRLADMGYWNPSLISFTGFTDDGNPVELIQHVSQISVLLTKLPRKDATAPKRRIGFHVEPETNLAEVNPIA